MLKYDKLKRTFFEVYFPINDVQSTRLQQDLYIDLLSVRGCNVSRKKIFVLHLTRRMKISPRQIRHVRKRLASNREVIVARKSAFFIPIWVAGSRLCNNLEFSLLPENSRATNWTIGPGQSGERVFEEFIETH